MNFKFGFLAFLFSIALITSCDKENIDDTVVDEDNPDTEVVECDPLFGVEMDVTGDLVIALPYEGVPPYSYVWSTGETTESVQSTGFGVYSVTITDDEGCTADASIDLGGPCDNGIEIVVQNEGGMLFAWIENGNPPYSYEWSTGDVGQTSETLLSTDYSGDGTYTLSITDSEGCTADASITVNACDDFAVASIELNGGQLCANATDGMSPYTYSWSTGDTENCIPAEAGNTYSVTITDAQGCTATQSYTVAGSSDCSSFEGVAVQNGNNLISEVWGGTPPYLYSWSTGETTEVISISESGVYTVNITDAFGCTLSFSIDAVVGGGSDDCSLFGEIYQIDATTIGVDAGSNATPVTYLWSTGETTMNINVESGNTYSVIITDADGCTIEDSFLVP